MEEARTSSRGQPELVRPRKARRKRQITSANLRSALTNGSSLLANVDHRSAWMRRLRDLMMAHEADLGGDANISEGERRLVKRAAMLTLQLEMMEQRWAANEGEASTKQIETYQRVTGALRRLLESLGLQRRSRDVTPTLDQYLRMRRQQEAEAEAAE
jgi:hypothetical protein